MWGTGAMRSPYPISRQIVNGRLRWGQGSKRESQSLIEYWNLRIYLIGFHSEITFRCQDSSSPPSPEASRYFSSVQQRGGFNPFRRCCYISNYQFFKKLICWLYDPIHCSSITSHYNQSWMMSLNKFMFNQVGFIEFSATNSAMVQLFFSSDELSGSNKSDFFFFFFFVFSCCYMFDIQYFVLLFILLVGTCLFRRQYVDICSICGLVSLVDLIWKGNCSESHSVLTRS